MALSPVILLDKIYGSPGKFTFYNLNSQTIVRRKAKTISNPKTDKQQANRENIPFLLSAFRNLRPLLIVSLNNRSHTRSAYNEFFSRNLNYSIIDGTFFPEKFKISTEDIPDTDFQVERIINASNKFQVSWTNVLSENQNDNDILCAIIYSPSENRFNYSITENIRLMKAAS